MATALLFDDQKTDQRQPHVHGSHNLTGAVEWYTPAPYIESARRVMGSIDCDPATSELAQKTIQAWQYYTIDDNGLTQKWRGNVWLNPPYAARVIRPFIDKLCAEYESGNVKQAILLTHNNADTGWFHKAATIAKRICFTRGRVRFYNSEGTATTPTHGHAFLYFGKRSAHFTREFKQYGLILRGV